MDEPKIRKPRSLAAKGYHGWSESGPTKKHFKVNGAVPDDAPCNGPSQKRNRKVCKKSPDHEHHYEVVVERAYRDFEQLVDTCTHCGHKKGYGFRVWTKPKPEWYIKLQERLRRA